MPSSCSAVGCTKRYSKKNPSVKFYRFPKDPKRRSLWVRAMRRDKWEPKSHSRLCSTHFIHGEPAKSKDDPDYVPSIFTFSTTSAKSNTEKKARYKRLIRRRENQDSIRTKRLCNPSDYVATSEQNTATSEQNVATSEQNTDTEECEATDTVLQINDEAVSNIIGIAQEVHIPKHDAEIQCNITSDDTQGSSVTKYDKMVVTDIDSKSWESVMQSLSSQQQLIAILKHDINKFRSPSARMEDDDKQTHSYTRLPSYALLITLLNLLLSVMSKDSSHGLHPKDQFLLVLMKLRLALTNEDLAYRFGITHNRVSQLFHEWIDAMSREFKQLIVWPDRQVIRETLPECFKSHYPRTTCIIDCSEVFIERASSLSARSETYSNYKSHNTAKFLVAITPTGAIIFISRCWGGRASDKLITSKSGFLDYLIHGDLILADRGFDITEDLALRGSTLAIPPFTKGKTQLSQREVEVSRELSRVRIHVERAIGRIKHYKLLQHTFPISLIKTTAETEFATIDKILILCAALSNLQPPLV